MFQRFLLVDNDNEERTSDKASNEMPPPNATKDQSKPKTAEQQRPNNNSGQSRPKTAEQQRQSRSGRTIKPSEKAREQNLQTQELIAHLTKLLDHN